MIAAPEFIYKSIEVHVGGSKHSCLSASATAREPSLRVRSHHLIRASCFGSDERRTAAGRSRAVDPRGTSTQIRRTPTGGCPRRPERRRSHRSAKTSRRVVSALVLPPDASLTASAAYFRYSSGFAIEAVHRARANPVMRCDRSRFPACTCDCSRIGLSSEMRRNASCPSRFLVRRRIIVSPRRVPRRLQIRRSGGRSQIRLLPIPRQ
jgi:hypothetical protein